MKFIVTALGSITLLTSSLVAQINSPIQDPRIQELVDMVSAERIEHDIRRLVGFGTRHTMSDTLSTTRGIGAARRWIYAEFERISQACGECLEVTYVSEVFDLFSRLPDSTKQRLRIPDSTNVVNVLAIQRGTSDPNRVLVMSGDIDSRISARTNYTDSAPGAVQPHARMNWQPPEDRSNLAGYRVYWRLTDSPTWDFSRWVGNQTEHTFDGLVIDNFFFGVASVSSNGSESTVAFPVAGSRSACAN